MKEEMEKHEENKAPEDEKDIEKGFEQMDALYRSRCIQVPTGANVTVKEINREE